MLHMIWFLNIQYPVRFSETEISQPGFVNILSPNFQQGKFFFFFFQTEAPLWKTVSGILEVSTVYS